MRIVVGRDASDDKIEWSPRSKSTEGDEAKAVIRSGEAIDHVKTACKEAGR